MLSGSNPINNEEQKPLSYVRSKVHSRFVNGFAASIVDADLYRLVLAAWLSKMAADLGMAEDPNPNELRSAYVERVFGRMRAMQLQLMRLDHVFTFLRSFPNRKVYERATVTRDVWIEYHVSVYLSTLSSLVDVSLLLVNEIHALGIRYERCKFADVESNTWLGGSETLACLKALNKAAQKTIQRRNADLHRAERTDLDALIGKKEQRDFAIAQFGSAMNYLLPMHHLAVQDVEQSTRKVLRALVSHLNADAKAVTGKLLALLAALTPEFERRLIDPPPFA